MPKKATLLSLLLLGSIQTGVQAGTVIIQEKYSQFFKARHDRLNGSMVDRFYSVPYGAGTYLRSEFTSGYTILPVTGGASSTGYEGITGDTVAYNPTTQSVYATDYDTRTTSRNGVLYSQSTITHSGTVVAPNGFNLESSVSPQWSYPDGNFSAFGTTEVDVNQTVDHYVDATGSWIEQAADFFSDIQKNGAVQTLQGRVRSWTQSQHAQKKNKTLTIPKKMIPLGVRGSVSMGGTSIHTASPGIMAYDITFGDADSIALPFAFGANKDGSTLEVFFEGSLLDSVQGDDYTLDELAFMDIDMTSLKGQSGLLEFIINTTGTNSANVFIPESLATTAVPVPAAAWLFGSGLLGLIGVARRKKAA